MNSLADVTRVNTALVEEHLTPARLAMMPRVFRLTAIHHDQLDARHTRCTASLYHDQASVKVSWIASYPDLRLKSGDMVSPRWLGCTTSANGTVKISRLILMERAEPWENLFQTVPYGWVKNRELVKQAAPCWLKHCHAHIDSCSMQSFGMASGSSGFAPVPPP